MVYYPINLDLNGKKVVVVGGGKVAERKITGLIEAMAVVTVISPKLTLELTEYAKEGKVYKQREENGDGYVFIEEVGQDEFDK